MTYFKSSDEEAKKFLKSEYTAIINTFSKSVGSTIINSCIDRAFNRIVEAYTQEDRYYHRLAHIADMVNEVNNIPEYQELYNYQALVLKLACFYHDKVYSFKSLDSQWNEPLSALDFIKDAYVLDIEDSTIKIVYILILNTWYSQNIKPLSTIERYMQDLDLMAFGYSDEDSKYIDSLVLKELSSIPDIAEKNRNFLTFLSDKAYIYQTDYFNNKYNDQAKVNIINRLKELEN